MPARLFCKTGELAEMAFVIDQEAVIGRLPENEISLFPSFISGRHACIYFDAKENGYFLVDLGSSNGTMLDGVAVTEPIRLERLHVITFAGQCDFIFQDFSGLDVPLERPGLADAASGDLVDKTQGGGFFDAVPARPREGAEDTQEKTQYGAFFGDLPPLPDVGGEDAKEDTKERTQYGAFFGDLPALPEMPQAPEPPETPKPEEKKHAADALAATPPYAPGEDAISSDDEPDLVAVPTAPSAAFELVVTLPDGTKEVFALREGANVLGREATCDLTVRDASISRSHACVTVQGERVFVEDLGSKNATYVVDEKLTGEVEIHPGAEVGFGHSVTATLRRKGSA